MRLIRAFLTLVVAAVLVLVGLAYLAHGRPATGVVYDTDFRGPKVTFDDVPQLERAPTFRVLVGKDRKSARWVTVNVAQYVSCDAGDQWNGQLCSEAALGGSLHVGARPVALALIGVAMVVTPIVAGLTAGGRRE